MNPVEIVPIQGTLILRARGSELLIMEHHILALKDISQPNDFVTYFKNSALINRPARKLFEAWLRKDKGLWQRVYKSVQEMEAKDDTAVSEGDAPVAASPKAAKVETANQEAPEKDDKKSTKKSSTKKAETKTAAKPAKKTAKKKTETKAVAKKAKKTTTAKSKTTTTTKAKKKTASKKAK